MLDPTARMIATVGIWISLSIILAFGVCQMHFNGDNAQMTFLVTIAFLAGAAAISTAFVWKK